MFYKSGILTRSSLLDTLGVRHGFSTREGGVSENAQTGSMNLTKNIGDSDDVVRRNTDIFASAVSSGTLGGENTVTAHQIHSSKVRLVTRANAGEGYSTTAGEDCDGFVTSEADVMPVVRVADCVPVLLCGMREDGGLVAAAVHAGWRGTVAGICAEAVSLMCREGCTAESIIAAIGAHIGACCYEIGDDFLYSVENMRGADFAHRHIKPRNGALYADLGGMNMEILLSCGIRRGYIDLSPECTCCNPDIYHSHRASGGARGTMGAGIAIIGSGA